MSGYTSGGPPVDWSNAYFQAPQPAFTGTDPGMGYYDALSGKPGAATDAAFSDKLTKAIGTLGKSSLANQPASSGGTMANAAAASPTGGGRAPSLDALLQLLNQRFQGLYPGGGGGGKGLLGV